MPLKKKFKKRSISNSSVYRLTKTDQLHYLIFAVLFPHEPEGAYEKAKEIVQVARKNKIIR